MNTFLLFLLGVAVIIIIVQATKKKNSPIYPSAENSKPNILKSRKLPDSFDDEYEMGFESFMLTGKDDLNIIDYIINNCKVDDELKLIHPDPDAPLAVAHNETIIGYIREDDKSYARELTSLNYTIAIETIDLTNGTVEIEFDYIIPKKKKTPKKVKKSTNPDIGPEDFMIWKTNEIPKEFLIPKKDIEDTSHYFYGKKICISGQLNSFPYRAELAKELHELGADVDTGVGKTCGILISGEGVGPSKLKKAMEQGVYIMDEHELQEKLNGFKSKYL